MESGTKLSIAVIVGSTRDGRGADAVVAWFTRIAGTRDDVRLDVIDLVHYDIPAHLPGKRSPDMESLGRRIAGSDAAVIVTPEYNHGYPASLKQAIDLTGEAWVAMPVGFVSYGGVSGGLRSVEQLRQILPELHALSVRVSVAIQNYYEYFNDRGELDPVRGCTLAVSEMIEELAWWARALSGARTVAAQGA